MRVLASLFLSLASGAATWTVGAILWSTFDPHGAGQLLLFSIPIALAATTCLAPIGVLLLVLHQPGLARRRVVRKLAQPVRKPVRQPPASAHPEFDLDDDLILAH